MRVVLKADLTPAKEDARNRVNSILEAYRLRYLTPGSAQALIYVEKSQEIERYRAAIAAGAPINPSDYPYAQVEADLYDMSLDNGIAFLEFYSSQWRDLAPITEGARRKALVKIDDAKGVPEIERVVIELYADLGLTA